MQEEAPARLKEVAHKIKGAAGNLRFQASYETARSLEKRLGEIDTIDDEARAIATRLVDLLWKLSSKIDSFFDKKG
jgi:HPt (histidine-containing phosphotransfer) domain-containing protein